MKLLHIGDLHIGKRVNEFSMLEDQEYGLEQILNIVSDKKPDAILIAGDVYDKSQPSAEAVELLDEFLTKLTRLGHPIFMISGNHDSPERLGFGSRIMKEKGLYIAGVFDGNLQKETIYDNYGAVNIYMMPFLKPAVVRPYFEQQIETYDEAIGNVINAANVNLLERNVLIAHQFVTSGTKLPERSDSESLSIGGVDNVDSEIFDVFDYVALGHLHSPQRIGRDTIRYAGSLLKYSFQEARHHKSVTILELGEKGKVDMEFIPLLPLHDLREIKGPIEELLKIGGSDREGSMDYIHATITDEAEIYDALGQLRKVYKNLMALDFENSRSRHSVLSKTAASGNIAKKSPMELFSEFYKGQNNSELSEKQCQVMEGIFMEFRGENI